MELIRGTHNLRDEHNGCVLTIGNFDGVHLGHQAVLAQVREKASQLGVPSAAMTFEPQPQELFQPDQAPARLTNWREKYTALKTQNIDRHIVIEFNKKFASQPAQEFIEQTLVKKLGVKFLVVGDDFRFGYKREGDFKLLQKEGDKLGFEVVDTRSYRQQQQRVSSTAIRQALDNGGFELAEQMLGRPYQIMGKVVHGRKNGRTIGFPTANVPLKRLKSPLHGVFAVTAMHEQSGQTYSGVANLGTRPTLNGDEVQLEVHLFEFSGNLYGQNLTVTPVAKLRNEQRFASLQHLQEQIEKDAARARDALACRSQ